MCVPVCVYTLKYNPTRGHGILILRDKHGYNDIHKFIHTELGMIYIKHLTITSPKLNATIKYSI